MDNPLHLLTEVFHPAYRVNLSIERLDGSLTLTLSNALGRVSKHLISPTQRNDRRQLQTLIEQVQRELEREPHSRRIDPNIGQRQPGFVIGLPNA